LISAFDLDISIFTIEYVFVTKFCHTLAPSSASKQLSNEFLGKNTLWLQPEEEAEAEEEAEGETEEVCG